MFSFIAVCMVIGIVTSMVFFAAAPREYRTRWSLLGYFVGIIFASAITIRCEQQDTHTMLQNIYARQAVILNANEVVVESLDEVQ